MSDNPEEDPGAPEHGRIDLMRDAVVFQGKLMIDGLRDLLLLPISVVATLFDLFSTEDQKGRRFYQVVHFGKRSEHWIDLFAAAERSPFESPLEHSDDHQRLDDLVTRVESVVKQQYAEGGVTGSARKALDKALETIGDEHRRHREGRDT